MDNCIPVHVHLYLVSVSVSVFHTMLFELYPVFCIEKDTLHLLLLFLILNPLPRSFNSVLMNYQLLIHPISFLLSALLVFVDAFGAGGVKTWSFVYTPDSDQREKPRLILIGGFPGNGSMLYPISPSVQWICENLMHSVFAILWKYVRDEYCSWSRNTDMYVNRYSSCRYAIEGISPALHRSSY